jgi:hypothetical protein
MKRVPDFRLRRFPAWAAFALLIYAIAFVLPYDQRTWGWQMFLLGLYVFYLPLGWPWLANPFFWFACGNARSSPATAFVLACISLVAALAFLPLFFFSGGFDSGNWPGPAYWCWTGSMAIAVVGSGFDLFVRPVPPRGGEASTRWPETSAERIPSPETPSEEYTHEPRA